MPSEALAKASFLTEVADQNGCRFRLAVKLQDPVQNVRAESQGVTCGSDGYAQGQGKLSVMRSDGVRLYSFNNGGFINGLAVTGKVPNLPVAGFDDDNNLLLSLLSEPASKVHYLLRLSRNYNGSWNADSGTLLTSTFVRPGSMNLEQYRHVLSFEKSDDTLAAIGLHRRGFQRDQGRAAVEQVGPVGEVPVGGAAVQGRVLAHGRDHDAVGQGQPARRRGQCERRKQE